VASDFKFDKTSLDMQSGSQVKVELRNQGQAEHNFTFTEAGANQDVEAGEDATATFTAPAAGSYQFFCKYHPSQMKGTVTVT
jgi:plastocyanin